MPRYSVVLIGLVFSIAACSGRTAEGLQSNGKEKPSSFTHGTVNIFVANRNGLVAVTDSRLSFDQIPVGEGQKLFTIDDHTICAIAGWFSSAGPSVDNVHYPAYSAIPNLIRFLADNDQSLTFMPVEQKLTRITDFVGFALNLVEEIAQASGDVRQPPQSQITLATFESGHLRMATSTLVAEALAGDFVYREEGRRIIDVKDQVAYIVRGISDVAEPILGHPEEIRGRDPILDFYRDSMLQDQGRSLSVKDMTQIARKLEILTSNAHRSQVGGSIQIAKIIDGKADLTDPFPTGSPLDKLNPVLLASSTYGTFIYSEGLATGNPNSAFLAFRGTFSHIKHQALDNILFFNSKFDHVTFYYNGSPVSFFDKSNTVSSCNLVVASWVSLSSPALVQIRKYFPDLPIEQEGQRNTR